MGNYVGSFFKPKYGLIRQNFAEESEALLNELINYLLAGSYACQSMSYYFDRTDIGLYGISDFCRFGSYFVCKNANKIMSYIEIRGGRVIFNTVSKPETNEWGTPMIFLEKLLENLRSLNDFILKVHENAMKNNDPSLTDFLEAELIEPITKIIRDIGVLKNNLDIAGKDLGEYEFNKDIEKNIIQYITENSDNFNVSELINISLF